VTEFLQQTIRETNRKSMVPVVGVLMLMFLKKG